MNFINVRNLLLWLSMAMLVGASVWQLTEAVISADVKYTNVSITQVTMSGLIIIYMDRWLRAEKMLYDYKKEHGDEEN